MTRKERIQSDLEHERWLNDLPNKKARNKPYTLAPSGSPLLDLDRPRKVSLMKKGDSYKSGGKIVKKATSKKAKAGIKVKSKKK